MNFVAPIGFRDVMSEEAQVREDLTARVQRCFAEEGYMPLETPTLERLDVMEAGGHVPQTPFKLFDSHGDLLAMRPDVTMQIARMYATRLAPQTSSAAAKFRYTQRVFRENAAEASARELTQFGVESLGQQGAQEDAALIALFAKALKATGLTQFVIAMGSARVLRELLRVSGTHPAWQEAVLQAFHTSNLVTLAELCAAPYGDAAGHMAANAGHTATDAGHAAADATEGATDCAAPAKTVNAGAVQAILQLAHLRGGKEVLAQVRALCNPFGASSAIDELDDIYQRLVAAGLESHIIIDFSVMSSFDYYTGVVFEAYEPGLGSPLGGGGRYDNLLAAYGAPGTPAAGFAFYLEQVMAAFAVEEKYSKGVFVSKAGEAISQAKDQDARQAMTAPQRPLRIAVPKGSLNKDAIVALEQAGLDTEGLADAGRTLMISKPEVEYLIVRPTDAPIFVALGAADCGICGEDSLVEASPEVVELVDLHFGACKFVVAESQGSTQAVENRYRKLGSIRVATKYPHITRAYYAKMGMQVEIVKLHGNIELAPITGMAERIVDITATGTTLRENNLVVVDDVLESTARFFANPASLRTNPRVGELAARLQENLSEQIRNV